MPTETNIVTLSIIIVNWNVKDFLRNCLKSVYDTIGGGSYEIIVVDNNSSDDSVDMIKNYFPNVRIIVSPSNLGFAKANNLGIKESRGRYILLLNPDTLILGDALKKLIKYMDENTNVGAAGGKLIAPNSPWMGGARHFPNLFTEFFDHSGLSAKFPRSKIFGYYWMSYWDHNSTRDIDLLAGALMIVRREAIEQAGLMDENIFMYAEDTDWCYRIKKAGWRISFVSGLEVIHYGERSSQQYSDGVIQVESLWSKYYYFKKHFGRLYAECYRLSIISLMFFLTSIWVIIYILNIRKSRDVARQIYLKRFSYFINLLKRNKKLRISL